MTGCPSTSLEVKASSDSLKCVHPEVYHCLRDQVGEKTQKCIKPSWIQKGLCAEYNTIAERLDAKSCQLSRGLCPDRAYLSNNVISYSGCAPTEIEVTSANTTTSNVNYTETGGTDYASVIIAVIIFLVVICLLVGVVYFIFQRRKQRRANGKDEENTDPLISYGKKGDNLTEEEKQKGERLIKEDHLKQEEKNLKFFVQKGECTENMLERIKKYLQEKSSIMIIGRPGSGKTTLAWTVCKEIHGEVFEGNRKWHVKTSTDTLQKGNVMTLLLLDGQFESAWITQETVEQILEKIKEAQSQNEQMPIILTISNHAYQQIENYDCLKEFRKWEIIDLDDKQNSLTTVQMGKVFETHGISICNSSEKKEGMVISQGHLDSIYKCFDHHHKVEKKVYTIPKLGFPLIATLIALNPNFLGDIDFVEKSIKRVLRSIRKLMESGEDADKDKYCTIVYAAFNGGHLDTNNMKDEDYCLLKTIGTEHKFPEAKLDPDFFVFRQRAKGFYEFVHESLLKAFFAAYGSQHLGFVIKNCPLRVLLENSVSKRETISDKEMPFFLAIAGTMYETNLLTRIRNEKMNIENHRIGRQDGIRENTRKLDMQSNMYRMKLN